MPPLDSDLDNALRGIDHPHAEEARWREQLQRIEEMGRRLGVRKEPKKKGKQYKKEDSFVLDIDEDNKNKTTLRTLRQINSKKKKIQSAEVEITFTERTGWTQTYANGMTIGR